MANTVISENILKLRELTEKMNIISNKDEYENVLKSIRSVIEEDEQEISNLISTQSKIKCYEKMCTKLNKILNNINF